MTRLIREDYKRKLDADFTIASTLEGEIQSVYSRYLCVRVAGFLEACLKEEISLFVEPRCPANIKKYIISTLQSTTNLTHNKIIKALQNFSQDWSEHYAGNVTEEMTQSIGSIYSNRNNIAHGQNSNITLQQVKKDYENIKHVVQAIHNAITDSSYPRR